eukprot:836835-Prorocentrum_minimum.AAC.1
MALVVVTSRRQQEGRTEKKVRAAERKVVGLRATWLKKRAVEHHMDEQEEDKRMELKEKRKGHAARVEAIKAARFRADLQRQHTARLLRRQNREVRNLRGSGGGQEGVRRGSGGGQEGVRRGSTRTSCQAKVGQYARVHPPPPGAAVPGGIPGGGGAREGADSVQPQSGEGAPQGDRGARGAAPGARRAL